MPVHFSNMALYASFNDLTVLDWENTDISWTKTKGSSEDFLQTYFKWIRQWSNDVWQGQGEISVDGKTICLANIQGGVSGVIDVGLNTREEQNETKQT